LKLVELNQMLQKGLTHEIRKTPAKIMLRKNLRREVIVKMSGIGNTLLMEEDQLIIGRVALGLIDTKVGEVLNIQDVSFKQRDNLGEVYGSGYRVFSAPNSDGTYEVAIHKCGGRN
jgi:hypothetical protein